MVDRLRHIGDCEGVVYGSNQYIVSRVDKRRHEERDWRVKMMKPTSLSSNIGRTTAAAVDDQGKGRRRAAGTVIEEREREENLHRVASIAIYLYKKSGALITRSYAYTIKALTYKRVIHTCQ